MFSNWTKYKKLKVNSFHRQGIIEKCLSDKFDIFAKTRKGTVEGFYHRRYPIIGIQWHPERKSPSRTFDRMLIKNIFNKSGSLF